MGVCKSTTNKAKEVVVKKPDVEIKQSDIHINIDKGILINQGTGSYEKDGRKIYTTEILVDNVTFTNGKKNKGQSSNNQQSQNSNQSNNNYTREDKDPFANDGQPIDISDDDLPF